MTTITWTFASNNDVIGFSHCWSKFKDKPSKLPLAVFERLFKEVDSIEGNEGSVHKVNGVWEGDFLDGLETHMGYILKSVNGNFTSGSQVYSINVKDVQEAQDHVNSTTGVANLYSKWYEYEHQDFSGKLSLGANYVGYPYLNDGVPVNNTIDTLFADSDGRLLMSVIRYGTEMETHHVGVNSSLANQWTGSDVKAKPGACYRIMIQNRYGSFPTDISQMKMIFRNPGKRGSLLNYKEKHYGPVNHYDGSPWKFYDTGEFATYKTLVLLKKPSVGGFGIKNIYGEQLLSEKYLNISDQTRKPYIWFGSTGHCAPRWTITAGGSGGARLANMVPEQKTASSVAIPEADTNSPFDKIKITVSGGHDFADKGGNVGFVTGFAGTGGSYLNGFRRIVYESSTEIYVWSSGSLFDQYGNSNVDSSGTIKVMHCGDGYGSNMCAGTSGGISGSEQGPVFTQNFGGVTGQPSTANFNKLAFTAHNGTPGNGLYGSGFNEWSGYSGGITETAIGITGGSWTDSEAAAGAGFGDGDETFTLTVPRFKATHGQPLNWDTGSDFLNLGSWINLRMCHPGYGFGVGNGDSFKLRVWDPTTQAYFSAKWVDENGSDIAAMNAGNIYFGTDRDKTSPDTPDTYADTAWSPYFLLNSVVNSNVLYPKPAAEGNLGLQLVEITNTN
jgi:hypothetical protein